MTGDGTTTACVLAQAIIAEGYRNITAGANAMHIKRGIDKAVAAVVDELTRVRTVIKIDCAEFQHSHEIAKLVGSPPGYLGHRETLPLLSQEMLNRWPAEKVKISFVLFDEIEKASSALWNLLLGILDKATLTLGDNRRVDFSRAMIFMTSNLGGNQINAIMEPGLGFVDSEMAREHAAGRMDDKIAGKIARTGTEAARRKFTPEFMNRLDKIVVFKPLGEAELRKILEIELGVLQQQIFSSGKNDFVLHASEGAKEHLLREGTDMKYGARHLKRAIERLMVQPISNLIATGQVRRGDLVEVGYSECGITFCKLDNDLTMQEMAEMTNLTPPAAATATAGGT